ncbi:cytochrome P450 [Lentithecium fluviatile CBS 122367]|uniref:Cytochrome P450 n=1 Tax=Lentithecium fluviatile CBS 122367 TaxID=1168545 RepID=A0A6G1J677_9PLEO|nr:cytochrome P450 [Lentithecium fluviatile CBS 122367]
MADFLRSTRWDQLMHNEPLAVALGLLSHYALNNGEWDHSSHLFVVFSPLVFCALVVTEYALDPQVMSVVAALQVTATIVAVYLGTLISSILIYRAFFHRLRKYPGAFGARLSKLHSLRHVVPSCQYYIEVEGLHRKYNSDIIRTGPRELSVTNADAIPLIHGPTSKCRKSAWYGGAAFLEGTSLQTTRSKKEHRERRKIWEHAFNAKALREYEPRLNRHALALMEKLKEHAHEPRLRISNWLNFYSFDVMGDVGFSRSFGMVEKGEEDELIKSLHASMAPLSYTNHALWLLGIVLRTSFGVKDLLNFMKWTSKVLNERKKITPNERDIFGHLMNPESEEIPKHLNADSRLLIVAGSDTTAATLTWLTYELCTNTTAQLKLRDIIDTISPSKSFLDAEDLANCPHLDGVINEALRLHPAVPSGVSRETPPEGLTLPDQRYIPGETIIWMPIHTIHRDPRYFPSPTEFMPERWTDEMPEFVREKRAFMPFGTGAYNCIGQKLAMMEMRTVAANLVRLFDVGFVEGEAGEKVVRETRDCFTLNVGALDVRLTPRRWE